MGLTVERIRAGITNTYLVRDRGAILVDPGQPGKASAVVRKLSALLPRLEDVRLIVVTHGHFDHVGCGHELRGATGAKIAVHRGDADWVSQGILSVPPGTTPYGRLFSRVGHVVLPRLFQVRPLQPDMLLDDAEIPLEEYGIAGRILPTPGHTPGSVSVLLDSGDLLVGDMAMNGPPFTWSPSLPIFAHDMDLMRETWERLLQRDVRTVHPGHGRPFPVEALHRALDRSH
jgi:glyoxylase-like metal-dependent hydrolase (beta-lactamase superfamily II)